jgi:hypothetical protein
MSAGAWTLVVIVGIAIALLLARRPAIKTGQRPPPRPSPPSPAPALSAAAMRSLSIEHQARMAAREDYADNQRRRANPYRRHSRDFVVWAIAYDRTWLDLEHAAQLGV